MAARTRSVRAPDPDPINDFDDIDQIADIGEGRRRRIFPIISIIFLLLLIGTLTAIMVFNLFNIRDQHIYPALRGVPLIRNIIPAAQVEYVYVYIDGEYVAVAVEPVVEIPPVDVAEFYETIAALTADIETAQSALNQAQALNRQYEETVQVLQVYRDFITEYRLNRQRFDEMIARGDPAAFAEFFRTVDPDTAARLYERIRADQQEDRNFRRYAATYHNMNSSEAGEVFTILLATDPGLLVRILNTFNTVQRAEVFNEMEPADVAAITRLMVPAALATDILPEIPLIGGGTPIPQITPPVFTPLEEAEEDEEVEETVENDDEDEQ